MRSHSLEPRSPMRFMGYLMRLGLYSAWMPARPFAQAAPLFMGSSGSPSSLTTLPSRTCAIMPQLLRQARQMVLIFCVSPDSAATAGSTCTRFDPTEPLIAAAAAAKAPSFTKLRRLMSVVAKTFLPFSSVFSADGSAIRSLRASPTAGSDERDARGCAMRAARIGVSEGGPEPPEGVEAREGVGEGRYAAATALPASVVRQRPSHAMPPAVSSASMKY